MSHLQKSKSIMSESKMTPEMLARAAAKAQKAKHTVRSVTWASGQADKHPIIRCLETWVASSWFNLLANLVILLNSGLIGLQLSAEVSRQDLLGDKQPFYDGCETFFLFVYIVELLMRLVAGGMKRATGRHLPRSCVFPGAFLCKWVCFDFAIVTLGVVSMFSTADGLNPGALRLLRLLRVLRTMHQFEFLQTLSALVRGLLSSNSTMFAVAFLATFTCYTFALIVLEYVTKPALHEEGLTDTYVRLVAEYFPNLSTTMLTLIGFITLDSAGQIYMPLIKEKPALALPFLGFILMASIALMNLVTAVIVENAIQSGNDQREHRVREEAKRRADQCEMLGCLFMEMDVSGDGELQREELLCAPKVIRDRLGDLLGLGCHISEENAGLYEEAVIKLFSVLDTDCSGSLGIDESVSGLLRITETSQLADRHLLVRMEKLCTRIANANGVALVKKNQSERRAKKEALRHLFYHLDADGDGQLTQEEIDGALEGDGHGEIYQVLQEICKPHDVSDLDLGTLFCELDTDGDGVVDQEEFLSAIEHLADFSTVRDRHMLLRLEKIVTDIGAHLGIADQHAQALKAAHSSASLEPKGSPNALSRSSSCASLTGLTLPSPAAPSTRLQLVGGRDSTDATAQLVQLAKGQHALGARLAASEQEQRRLADLVETLVQRLPPPPHARPDGEARWLCGAPVRANPDEGRLAAPLSPRVAMV